MAGVVGGVARGLIGGTTIAGGLVESRLLILRTFALETCAVGSGVCVEESVSASFVHSWSGFEPGDPVLWVAGAASTLAAAAFWSIGLVGTKIPSPAPVAAGSENTSAYYARIRSAMDEKHSPSRSL